MPWMHDFPAPQALPQLPQLLLSVWVLTQVGEPVTVHTVGALLGQLQVCEQIRPLPCSWTMRQVAPLGQHICCRPGAQPEEPRAQVNALQ